MNDLDHIHRHEAVTRVRDLLRSAGEEVEILVMTQPTHTSAAAAAALGVGVGEIAKSVIFKGEDGHAVLVIASGANRVDTAGVSALLGVALGKADADFVREKTGYVIGGVAPVGHLPQTRILMDEDLMQYAAVYPAAGHPNTMFRIAPAVLLRVAGATPARIAQTT